VRIFRINGIAAQALWLAGMSALWPDLQRRFNGSMIGHIW
jgi:hypothetical protein